jgi:F-type H+-transporting ATPase subunit gamma
MKQLSDFILDKYLEGDYKEVVIFYNYFQNTMSQIAVRESFLPIEKENIFEYLLKITGKTRDEIFNPGAGEENYEIEPSEAELVDMVIPMVLRMMIYDKLLESKASEHSSRMIAMKNAKESSKKIASKLTLQYNNARQAAITREVSEIVSGVESMKD